MSLHARPDPDDVVARTAALGGLLAGAAALAALSLQGLTAQCVASSPCQRLVQLDPLVRLALGAFAGGSLALAAGVATARQPTHSGRRVRRLATGAVALPWAVGATALGVGWWFAVAEFRQVAPVAPAPVALALPAALSLLSAAVVATAVSVRGDGGEAATEHSDRPFDLRATLLGTGRLPVATVALGAALGVGAWVAGAWVTYPGLLVARDLLFLAAAVAVPAAVAARGEGLAAAWAAGVPGWLVLYLGTAASSPAVGGAVLAAVVQTLAWGSLGYVLGTEARRWFAGWDGAREVVTRS